MKKTLILLIVLTFVLNLFACSVEKEQNNSTVSTNSTSEESLPEESPIDGSIAEETPSCGGTSEESVPDESTPDESTPDNDDPKTETEGLYYIEYDEDPITHHRVKYLRDAMIIEPTGRKKLTIEKVLEIAASRGENLSWVDFEDYECDQNSEIETTNYIDESDGNIETVKRTLVSLTRIYFFDSYSLYIEGENISSTPEYVTLSFYNKDRSKHYYYDIRNGDLENVLKNGIKLPEGENVKFETKAYRDVPEVKYNIKKFNEEYSKQFSSTSLALIENYNELSDICHRLLPNWEENSNRSEPIKQLLNDYDESFFDNNVLIITTILSGSGSTDYSVSNVRMFENSLYIDIRSDSPEVGTADEMNWILSVSISRTEMENVENIYANGRWSYHDGEKSPYMEIIKMPYKK